MWNVFKCIMVAAALMWFSFICVSFKHLLRLMPVHENEIVSNSSSDSSSPNWCIFVGTRFYGNHSSSRRTATLNWFEDVTLPSIVESYSRWQSSSLRATSGVSLSVHFMLSISDSYHDYSFPKHFAHKKHGVKLSVLPHVKQSSQSLIFTSFMLGAVRNSDCSVVSFGRIDGDDMLDSYFLEIIGELLAKYNANNHHIALDTAVMHGTKKTRKVFWSNFGCQYVQYKTPYAMSQGLTITLPRDGFVGSKIAQILFQTSHTRVMDTIKKEVNALQRSNETSRGDEWWIPSSEPLFLPMPLDTSVFAITVLSSHWEDYKKAGPLKDCAFLRNDILSKEMFDILNSSRIPNLTESDISENHFIKKKTKV